jgi:hypothetical protein
MLAAAICEQDEGYTLRLQVRESLLGARQWVGAPDKHSVDTDSRQWWLKGRMAGLSLYSNAKPNSGTLVDAATVCSARRVCMR